jgi:hypothetical protein
MLLLNCLVVVKELKWNSQSPEDRQETAEESPDRTCSAQVLRKKQADKSEADEHQNDVERMDGENLADDGRDLREVLPVLEDARQKKLATAVISCKPPAS